MSSAIKIPSHTSSNHLDVYSKTYSGQMKGKMTAMADRGRHVSDNRRYDTCGTDRDSDCEEMMDHVSSSLTDKPVWGSVGAGGSQSVIMRPGRALVNPFDPSNVTVKLTSNRRRWTHIFPKVPASHAVAGHVKHVPAVPGAMDTSAVYAHSPGSSCSGTMGRNISIITDTTLRKISDFSIHDKTAGGGSGRKQSEAADERPGAGDTVTRLGSLMWGVSGDQTWDATMSAGVDWRSITWPACLPITTDYFPDKRAFENDYVVNQYVIIPDEINSDYATRSPLQKPALKTREVFLELICQRLAQGFQLIINQKDELSEIVKNVASSTNPPNQSSTISNLSLFLGSKSSNNLGSLNKTAKESYWLSIGKNFHHIILTGNTIDVVTKYWKDLVSKKFR